MNRFLLTLLCVGFAGLLVAQTVPSFKYQGVARNSQNVALTNVSVGLKMTILNSSNVAVYSETFLTRTSELGIFSVNICSGQNPQGSCSTIDWSVPGYQLKVEMDPAGGTSYLNMGNSPILAVPIAVYAAKAGSVPGDTDPSPTNEIQQLAFDNASNKLTISQGNNVDLTPLKNDADADVTNEIQVLALDTVNSILSLSKSGGSVKLGGLGSTIWVKTASDLTHQFNPNAFIKFSPSNFTLNFGTGTAYKLNSLGITNSEEYFPDNSTNLDKYAWGNSIQGYQNGRYVQNYLRKDKDTMFFMRVGGNYVFPAPNSTIINPLSFMNVTSLALNGNTPVNVTSAYISAQGGLGTVANALGGRPGGALTAAVVNNVLVPYVGLFNPTNPQQLVGGIYWDGSKSIVNANVKNFWMDHPKDPTKEIWYASLEGPEAGAYERGTFTLVNGEAFVPFSDHFENVINPSTLTIQMTPLSADSEGLAVIEKTPKGFRVRELRKGTGNYKVDWEAKGVRAGYENYKVVRTKGVDTPRPTTSNDFIKLD
ncbi:MAG TPA: hypothetical protein PKD32_01050 [Saprospiraceae bacterium]|nr:hypothetical protein [Saprospiraceae bacterium]